MLMSDIRPLMLHRCCWGNVMGQSWSQPHGQYETHFRRMTVIQEWTQGCLTLGFNSSNPSEPGPADWWSVDFVTAFQNFFYTRLFNNNNSTDLKNTNTKNITKFEKILGSFLLLLLLFPFLHSKKFCENLVFSNFGMSLQCYWNHLPDVESNSLNLQT